jgi:hypothetical protein
MPVTPSNNISLLVTGIASKPVISDLLVQLLSHIAGRGFGQLVASASPERTDFVAIGVHEEATAERAEMTEV